MSWNYRVIYHPPSKHKIGDKEFKYEEYLAIHEVYYDKKGKATSVTVDGIIIGDEGKTSLSSLKIILINMIAALQKPILNYDEF